MVSSTESSFIPSEIPDGLLYRTVSYTVRDSYGLQYRTVFYTVRFQMVSSTELCFIPSDSRWSSVQNRQIPDGIQHRTMFYTVRDSRWSPVQNRVLDHQRFQMVSRTEPCSIPSEIPMVYSKESCFIPSEIPYGFQYRTVYYTIIDSRWSPVQNRVSYRQRFP